MTIWRFLWNAVWREAGPATRVVQSIAVTVPFVIGLVIGVFGGEWSKELWPIWIWALITLVAFLGSIILGVLRRAYELERNLEPTIVVSDPIEGHDPWNRANHEKSKRYYSIEIENISTTAIKGVRVKELSFVNRLGHTAPEAGRHFRLLRERGADPNHSFCQTFDLNGAGDRAAVLICEFDELDDAPRVVMTYAEGMSANMKNSIQSKMFPHQLTIRVTAENLPRPVDKKFEIAVSDEGFLRMTAI